MAKNEQYKKRLATASLAEAQAMDKAYADAHFKGLKEYTYNGLKYAVTEAPRTYATDIVKARTSKQTPPVTTNTTTTPTTPPPTTTKTTTTTKVPSSYINLKLPEVKLNDGSYGKRDLQGNTYYKDGTIVYKNKGDEQLYTTPITPEDTEALSQRNVSKERPLSDYRRKFNDEFGIPNDAFNNAVTNNNTNLTQKIANDEKRFYRGLKQPEIQDNALAGLTDATKKAKATAFQNQLNALPTKRPGNFNYQGINKQNVESELGVVAPYVNKFWDKYVAPKVGFANGGNLPKYYVGGPFDPTLDPYAQAQAMQAQYGTGQTTAGATGGLGAGITNIGKSVAVGAGDVARKVGGVENLQGIAGMGLQGASQAVNMIDGMDGKPSKLGGVASGALSGASMGAVGGLPGMAAGAVVGGGLALLQAEQAKKEQQRADKRYMSNLTDQNNFTSQQTLRNYASHGVTSAGSYGNGGELPEYGKGGKIHIKKENRGKFTAYKKRTGKTTAEALHSKDPHVRQMANFARNAKKWKHKGRKKKHALGGEIEQYYAYPQFPDGGILDKTGQFINEGVTKAGRAVLPINAAMYAQDLTGNLMKKYTGDNFLTRGIPTPLTEKDLTPEELAVMRQAQQEASYQRDKISEKYPNENFPKELSYDAYPQNNYTSPDPKDIGGLGHAILDPSNRMMTTVGGAMYHKNKRGEDVITDKFDFAGKNEQRLAETSGELANPLNPYGYIHNFIGKQGSNKEGSGIPVNINLGKPKPAPRPIATSKGKKKLALGGEIEQYYAYPQFPNGGELDKIKSPIEALDYPQKRMMEMITGRYEKPSDALLRRGTIDNSTMGSAAGFAVDLLADPMNLLPASKLKYLKYLKSPSGYIPEGLSAANKLKKAYNYSREALDAVNILDNLKEKTKYPYGGMPEPEYEVEGGEMIQGQDINLEGQQQQVASDMTKVPDYAPSHADGGVEGSGGDRVFSDRMKTANKKTYAEEAEKLAKDKAKFEAKIPSTNEAIRNTGQRMSERVDMKLDELFNEQEMKKMYAMPSYISSSMPAMRYGGNLPKFPYGTSLPYSLKDYKYGKGPGASVRPLPTGWGTDRRSLRPFNAANQFGEYNAETRGRAFGIGTGEYVAPGRISSTGVTNTYPEPVTMDKQTGTQFYVGNDYVDPNAMKTLPIRESTFLPSQTGRQHQQLPLTTVPTATTGVGGATAKAMKNGEGIPWQYVDNLAGGIMTANTPELAKPYMDPRVDLNTNYDINPQLSSARNTRDAVNRSISASTPQGGASAANRQQLFASSVENENSLYAQKNNIENELKNKEILLNSGINSRNMDKQYAYDVENVKRRAGIQQDIVGNAQNFAVDQYTSARDAKMDARDLENIKQIAMANPNGANYGYDLKAFADMYASDPVKLDGAIAQMQAISPDAPALKYLLNMRKNLFNK